MSIRFILAAICLSFWSCTPELTDSEKIEEMILSEPPSTFGFGTDTSSSKLIIDSTLAIYEKAGGASLVDSDLYVKKCNRYMLTYKLNQTVKDTALLKEIISHLGHEWHLRNIRTCNGKTDCPYDPMTSLFLYDKTAKEFYGDWLAMIAFNPDHPNGEVSLSWRIKWK